MKKIYFILIISLIIAGCNKKHSVHKENESIKMDSLLIDTITYDSILVPNRIGIKMNKVGGVYEIPCLVNGVKMNFIFDTGASNVCISLTEALFLYKNGYIDDDDIGESSYSQVADGGIVENTKLKIRKIEIEGIEIYDVEALVVRSLSAPLLLGQSAIQKIGKIEINGDSIYIIGKSKNHDYDKKVNKIEIPIPPTNPTITWWDKFIAWCGNENKVNDYVNKSLNAWKNDLEELAINYCDKAIECNNKNWKPYALKGKIYYQAENFEQALDNFQKFEEYNKKKENLYLKNDTISYINILVTYAYSFVLHEDFKQAIQVGQKVLEICPQNERAMDVISASYTLLGRYELAEKWAKKMVEIDKGSAYFRLAYLYSQQGRDFESIKYYRKLLIEEPKNAMGMNNLSDLLLENGSRHEAIELKKQAAKLGNKISIEWLKKHGYKDW